MQLYGDITLQIRESDIPHDSDVNAERHFIDSSKHVKGEGRFIKAKRKISIPNTGEYNWDLSPLQSGIPCDNDEVGFQ